MPNKGQGAGGLKINKSFNMATPLNMIERRYSFERSIQDCQVSEEIPFLLLFEKAVQMF